MPPRSTVTLQQTSLHIGAFSRVNPGWCKPVRFTIEPPVCILLHLQAWNFICERARQFSFCKGHFHLKILRSVRTLRKGSKAPELLKQEILLNSFLLSRNEQDTSKQLFNPAKMRSKCNTVEILLNQA